MENLKKLILQKGSRRLVIFLILNYRYLRKSKNLIKTFFFTIKAIFKFYIPSKRITRGKQIQKLFKRINIEINEDEKFVYSIDEFKTLYRKGRIIDNTTIDYSKVLNTSIEKLKKEYKQLQESEYKNNEIETLNAIEELINREISAIEKSKKENKEQIINYFERMKSVEVQSFEEALQRILFYHQMLWQTGHVLSGLGRLDKILNDIYIKEKEEGKINKKIAKENIKEFMKILHNKCWYKSNVLIGDTGQIIILGGKEKDGSYFFNDLTYLFIEATQELQIPEPKVLLRVTKETPRELIEKAVQCIKTGVGSPLISNDDVVIPKLKEFGYGEDSYNYVTSACWEPLIPGKSIAPNNIDSLVFIEPLNKMLENEELNQIKDIDIFLEKYKEYLQNYIKNFIKDINEIEWELAPLVSLFVDGTKENMKDVSLGSAVYHNCGLTTVSLSNTVNSIYNIKKLVFEEKKYTLLELNRLRKENFETNENVLKELKEQENRFGVNNKEIIELTNQITEYANEVLEKEKNVWGGKIKIGFSAPTYIIKSQNCEASFDGRKKGEPFGVHISSDKENLPYTELIEFSANLDYSGHRFNGNVVDFMISPNFMEDNFDKIVDFFITSIKIGFFQMQVNVVSSETLIKAKKNPQDYPNLIVRVWGFSAYFNELPEEYKDLLIERALKSEGKSY